MLANALYNFYAQLVQESKSAKRIKLYIDDAADDDQKEFWTTMLEQKKENIASLETMVKAYCDANCGCCDDCGC